MFYFIAQNLRKLGIILDGTYLLLNLQNIHYAQLFIRLKRIKQGDNKKFDKINQGIYLIFSSLWKHKMIIQVETFQ